MLERIDYRPYGRKTDFVSIVEDGTMKGLDNIKWGYRLTIRENGYVPKTGVFLAEKMSEYDFKGKRIIDIGTGETGILAIQAAQMGAEEVVGLDIDEDAIAWAMRNARINNLDNVVFESCDIKEYRPHSGFDIIISNPPQMPAEENLSSHDDGGQDGREYIEYILDFSSRHLGDGGMIIFSSFDFLGVDRSYDGGQSLVERAKGLGLEISISGKQEKTIKKDSYTYQRLSWIEKKYPHYPFCKDDEGLAGYFVCAIVGRKIIA